MTRRYAIYDAAALGADLDIQRGGVLVTTIVDALDINRTARGTVAVEGYESIYEVILFGLSGTPIANKVSVGIVTADASLSLYVGGDEFGMGYRPGEGQIHHDGASVATVTAGAMGDVTAVRYTPDGSGGGTVSFYRKPVAGVTVLLGSQALPADMQNAPLYIAVSLGSVDDPGDLSLALNAGQDAWEAPVLTEASAGWWETPALAGALRVSDLHYLSGREDAPPFARWYEGITAADIIDDSALNFWIWGTDGAARGSAVQINVTDPIGLLDDTLGGAYRDQPASLKYVEAGAALNTAIDLGQMIVERVEATGEIERRITLRDPLAQFDSARLQPRRIRPDADVEAANRPWPTLIGAGFSLPVVLLDQGNRVYAIDSLGTTAVGRVRDRGNPLDAVGDPGALPDPIPPDYVVSLDGQTLTLENEPVGIVTVDAVVSGGALPDPPSPVDELAGVGNPFDGVIDGAITGWDRYAAISDLPRYIGAGKVAFQQNITRISRINATGVTLTAGTTYRIRLRLHQMQPAVGTGGIARLLLCQADSQFSEFATINGPLIDGFVDDPTDYVFMHTALVDHGLWIFYTGNSVALGQDCIISAVSATIIPPPVEDGDEDETDEELAALALPLADMLEQGIETRGGFDSTVWDRASAEAIDTASGYAGQGFWATDQVTLSEYVDTLLDAYTACAFRGDDGRLTFARLVAPENETATGDIGLADILTPPLPRWDEMRGLTRQAGARRNEFVFDDSDLASDLTAVGWRARRKLTRRHRIIATSGARTAPGLEHAETAEPLDTRLLLRADVQAELDRVLRIAGKARSFYGPFDIVEPGRFALGQIVTLTYPRFGLDTGRKVMIVRITKRRLARTGQITCWGLSPTETD